MRNLSDIVKAETPGIAAIAREHGPTVAKAIVILALDDLIQFYNVSNTFTDQQINFTADLIMQEFYWLKPEDFKLCFNNAKLGRYGTSYNRLDGAVVSQWIEQYITERAEFFAHYNEKKHENDNVRQSDVKEMHKLYDKVVSQSLEEEALRQKKKQLRQEAKEQWQMAYDKHFEGVEITPDAHFAYLEKFPLNESYFQYYIRKNLHNG